MYNSFPYDHRTPLQRAHPDMILRRTTTPLWHTDTGGGNTALTVGTIRGEHVSVETFITDDNFGAPTHHNGDSLSAGVTIWEVKDGDPYGGRGCSMDLAWTRQHRPITSRNLARCADHLAHLADTIATMTYEQVQSAYGDLLH